MPAETKPRETQNIVAPETSPLLVKMLTFIKPKLGEVKSIYYPCSGSDISVTQVFPDAKVLFVDNNKAIVEALKKADFQAREEDATKFKPDTSSDLVLLENPQIGPEKMVEAVKEEGFVACNNWSLTADHMYKNPDFKIVGVVNAGDNDELTYDEKDLDDYFKPVETEDEFKKSKSGLFGINYDQAREIVMGIFKVDTDILKHYKELLEQAKKAALVQKAEYEKQHPGETVGLDERLLAFEVNGRTISVPPLPKKKTSSVDFFVFQKIKKEEAKPEEQKAA